MGMKPRKQVCSKCGRGGHNVLTCKYQRRKPLGPIEDPPAKKACEAEPVRSLILSNEEVSMAVAQSVDSVIRAVARYPDGLPEGIVLLAIEGRLGSTKAATAMLSIAIQEGLLIRDSGVLLAKKGK